MINAVDYDKPLTFIEATFREKLVSRHRAVNEANSCLHMRPAVYLENRGTNKGIDLIGRLVGVKLPKTADHWSVNNRSAAFCL